LTLYSIGYVVMCFLPDQIKQESTTWWKWIYSFPARVFLKQCNTNSFSKWNPGYNSVHMFQYQNSCRFTIWYIFHHCWDKTDFMVFVDNLKTWSIGTVNHFCHHHYHNNNSNHNHHHHNQQQQQQQTTITTTTLYSLLLLRYRTKDLWIFMKELLVAVY
jgi:hypothetical protein